jgi:serine phosphatase RsbU (regulator of sigma subunit)
MLFCKIYIFCNCTVNNSDEIAYAFDFIRFNNLKTQLSSSSIGITSGNEIGVYHLTDLLLLLVLILAILILMVYVHSLHRTKAYNKLLENQLKMRTEKIMSEQNRLREQNQMIAEHSKNLRDSIAYAKHIQNALLPAEDSLLKLFPESFASVVSKELVSGDFYWLAQKYDTIYLAVADCTGHGVPGAFMSLIGRSLLEDTINNRGVLNPANILSEMRLNMLNTLCKNELAMSNDGMDLSLCAFNPNNKILNFAGANQSLYVLRPGNKPLDDIHGKSYQPLCSSNNVSLYELKADRQPIGNHYGPAKAFTNYTVKLEPNDRFYAFTDGFRDQFGGLSNKKLKCTRFRTMLLKSQHLKMAHQKEWLLKSFHDWKGSQEQNDDICLVGVQV